ncbi:MAG TPA: hypothetical protein VMY38_03625 [Gemmatimonadaceae bacterium]|nr:hypothetical protein [Gemmatimonadaceae bacterium]
METSASTVPPRLLAFFVAEAVSYADTLREIMWLPAPDRDTARMLGAARGLRGASTMVRLSDLAVVAGRMERIARAVHTRRIQWTEPLSYSLQAVLYELPELISAAPAWGPGESERAAAIADALHAFAPSEDRKTSAMVIPIARLFHDDSGPHVIYVAVTPQTQFEQQLREPAPDRSPPAAARAQRARTAPPPASARASAGTAPQSPAPPPRPSPVAEEARTTPRGQDLHSLISEGLASFAGMELETPPAPAAAAGVVPIESLLYTGRAALARAREIRSAQAAAAREPTPEELDELMDLMELATSA